jgi:hypothetical protein
MGSLWRFCHLLQQQVVRTRALLVPLFCFISA